MKTCPRCGVENKPDRAACWNCWAPLDAPAGGAAEPKPVGRGVSVGVPWTAVVVVLIVLVAAAGVYFFLLSSKPADVAANYLLAVRNGNEAKRNRLASSDTTGDTILPQYLMVQDFEVDRAGENVSGKQADVPATVHFMVNPEAGLAQPVLIDTLVKYLGKKPVRANLVLVKEGFNWRVDQRQTQKRFQDALLMSLVRGLPAEVTGRLVAILTGKVKLPPPPVITAAPRAPAPAAAPAGKLGGIKIGFGRSSRERPSPGAEQPSGGGGDLEEGGGGGLGRRGGLGGGGDMGD